MDKNYVKEYKGHKVPEGASCFVEACEAYRNHFGKTIDGVDYVFAVDSVNPEWVEISDMLPLSARGAIPLPEEQSQEWVDGLPPIGTECEVTDYWNDSERPVNLNSGQEVKILMDYKCPKTGADGVIFTWIEGADYIRAEWTGNEKHFRPLKTQEQKDREAFIEWAKSGLSYRLEELSFACQVIEQLADNGAKAPEGEQMSTFDKLMVIFLVFAVSLGMNLTFHKDITERLKDYHCAPIQKGKHNNRG